jgi:hypothetical protein
MTFNAALLQHLSIAKDHIEEGCKDYKPEIKLGKDKGLKLPRIN